MTEPTGLLIVVSLGSAFLGAAGAVGAQIAANVWQGKRESVRLDFDKSVQDGESRRRQDELFFESKRIAFVQVLKLADQRLQAMHAAATLFTDIEDNQTWHYLADEEWFDRWRELRAEIALLDPAVEPDMRVLLYTFTAWANEIGWNYIHQAIAHANEIGGAVSTLRDNMQQSLGALR